MTDKAIIIFDKKKEKEEETSGESPTAKEGEASFEEIAKSNAAKKKKMEAERLNANKSVLRSYRIKH